MEFRPCIASPSAMRTKSVASLVVQVAHGPRAVDGVRYASLGRKRAKACTSKGSERQHQTPTHILSHILSHVQTRVVSQNKYAKIFDTTATPFNATTSAASVSVRYPSHVGWPLAVKQAMQHPVLRGPRGGPVGEVSGGSSGLANTQPVCSSLGSSGRVRCHVGCVTDNPMTSCRPCLTQTTSNSDVPDEVWPTRATDKSFGGLERNLARQIHVI